MKYEYIPIPKNNKTKKIAVSFFFAGAVLFTVGGLKMIPFRSLLQLAAIASFTVSIMLVGRFLLRYYAYRIEDMGEGDELFVDEITRKTRYSVCRLEMRKLVGIYKMSELSREERGKKRYNYCPDAFTSDAYLLEFVNSDYDNTAEHIRISIQPDEKLIAILNETLEKNRGENSEE